ncbi:hypothetical protein I7I48_03030 [Histoplasma ohiense]|nr:hypothetical protein I7I48_03030 [Histoplasma ohiense (nom. inval.)]
MLRSSKTIELGITTNNETQLTHEQLTQFLVLVVSHANSSKQTFKTLTADHYFHETTPQSFYHLFCQMQMSSSSTQCNQQQYPTGISLPPLQLGGFTVAFLFVVKLLVKQFCDTITVFFVVISTGLDIRPHPPQSAVIFRQFLQR